MLNCLSEHLITARRFLFAVSQTIIIGSALMMITCVLLVKFSYLVTKLCLFLDSQVTDLSHHSKLNDQIT